MQQRPALHKTDTHTPRKPQTSACPFQILRLPPPFHHQLQAPYNVPTPICRTAWDQLHDFYDSRCSAALTVNMPLCSVWLASANHPPASPRYSCDYPLRPTVLNPPQAQDMLLPSNQQNHSAYRNPLCLHILTMRERTRMTRIPRKTRGTAAGALLLAPSPPGSKQAARTCRSPESEVVSMCWAPLLPLHACFGLLARLTRKLTTDSLDFPDIHRWRVASR
jgi:hypothetical protein